MLVGGQSVWLGCLFLFAGHLCLFLCVSACGRGWRWVKPVGGFRLGRDRLRAGVEDAFPPSAYPRLELQRAKGIRLFN